MAGVDDWGALLPGQRIAGYEIRRKLGQGGFGIAYEGFNADLRLQAAIKEFFPRDFVGRSGTAVSVREKGQEEFYQRFLNRFIDEARAVHRLNHPNIVKVRHFERANNTAYVVMDYIDGAPLKDWLAAHLGKLTEADLRAVFEPVVDALGYVHDHDMLHRDVSPANIMVDMDGKPWLIDFGAFKELWKDQPRRTTVQAANPAYAAPEQLDEMAGQGHGPFTDIFALSATMYEAIAGKKPSSAMSRTVSLVSGRADSLEPLGQAATVKCKPTVVATVMKGLSLSPAARPQTIGEMRAAMGWVKGTTTVAWREPPRTPRAPPPTPTAPPSPHVEEVIRTALQLNPGLGKERSSPLSPPAARSEPRRRSRGGLLIGLVAALAVSGALGAFIYRTANTDSSLAITAAKSGVPKPVIISPSTERSEIRSVIHLSNWGDKIDIEIAPAEDGSVGRLTVKAVKPGTSPDWVTFALRNASRLPLEAWLSMDDDEIVALTPSVGFVPEKVISKSKSSFKLTLAPGQTVTYIVELATAPRGNRLLYLDRVVAPQDTQRPRSSDPRRTVEPDAPPDPQPPRKVATVPISRTGEPLIPIEKGLKVLTSAEEAALKPKDEFQECENCPRMVVIPAGKFLMGSPPEERERDDNEGPLTNVTIPNPLAVGKFEITFREWDECVRDGGCLSNLKPSDSGWGRDSRPVINVSWNHAQEFMQWLSRRTGKRYRLLTEHEWEYAAKSGSTTAYWWGDTASHDFANYGADNCCLGRTLGRDQWLNTAPVGQFPANPFGLHDMHGNVWEFVQNCYAARYDTPCSDRQVAIRGGAWDHAPKKLRSAFRQAVEKTHADYGIGFRVARDLATFASLPQQRQQAGELPAPKQPVPKRAANAPSPPTDQTARSAKEQYEAAYGLLLQQNYVEAEKEFGRFVSTHPSHELAPNATYWLAESMWVQGTHKRALAANYYAAVIGRYPSSPKAQDSLLRLATFYFDNNKNKQLACEQFNILDAKYPNAPAHVRSKAQSERQRMGC